MTATPRATRASTPWAGVALAALMAVYALVALDGLTRLPPVHDDEMWNAAPAFKLATTGVYGSDLFAGFHRAERRTYQFMPMLQLLLAAAFGVFGVGLAQIRLVSVAAGAVVVVLTYAVGHRLGGPRVGLLAAGLLVGGRLATGSLDTGLVLVDIVRVTRYHVLVPVFGLAALLVFSRAEAAAGGRTPTGGYAAAGALAGGALLSHVYGAFWLAALGAVLIARRGWRATVTAGATWALAGGFALAVAPWIVYVFADLEGYLGQMSMYRDRFALLDPAFYVQNLLREPYRYAGFGVRDLLTFRPAAWFALAAGAPALVAAVRVAHHHRRDPVAAAAIALLVQVLLYAVLLQWKTFSYLLNLLPLMLALIAWKVVAWWDASTGLDRRVVLVGALILVAGDGAAAAVARHHRLARTTSYDDLIGGLRAHVPAGARIVGSPRFWLGFRDHPYRAWALMALLSDRGAGRQPAPMSEALAGFAPDVVLFDRGAFLEATARPGPWRWQYESVVGYLRAHGARRILAFDDPTWGPIEMHLLEPPSTIRR